MQKIDISQLKCAFFLILITSACAKAQWCQDQLVRFGLGVESLRSRCPKGWYVHDKKEQLLLETFEPGIENSHSAGIPSDGASVSVKWVRYMNLHSSNREQVEILRERFQARFKPTGTVELKSEGIIILPFAKRKQQIYEVVTSWPQLKNKRSLFTINYGIILKDKNVIASLSFWSDDKRKDLYRETFNQIVQSIR